MQQKLLATIVVPLLLLLQFTDVAPAPMPQNDIDDMGLGGLPISNSAADYNMVMGHFKDFFMYLPVMMTTLRETMTGFPKFAEGIRVLTSKTGRLDDEGECNKCNKGGNSNEI